MENVKIKQIKGADPEKRAFLVGGGRGTGSREKAKKGTHPFSLSQFPFPDSGTSLLTLATQVEGNSGKRIPGSVVLFSRGKVMVQSPYTKPLMGFFKQPEFKSSTGQYEWEHVILTSANYNSQT